MTRGKVRGKVVTAKIDVIREMFAGIASLPLGSLERFREDPRMTAAGESYLRRGLEAFFDLGRHLLAKGFAVAAPEYKAVAVGLREHGVVDPEVGAKLSEMAGYRNRMVHFYDKISHEELYEILTGSVGDLDLALERILEWVDEHPEIVDDEL